MKYLAITFLLIGIFSNIAAAQNSVKISQKGSGNMARISQSTSSTTKSSPPCVDSVDTQNNTANRNIFFINRFDSNKNDSLWIAASGINTLKQSGRNEDLKAAQNGHNNNLYIIIPSEAEQISNTFNANQKGSKNWIGASMTDSSSINLFQSGSNNYIAINPCEINN